MSQLIEVKVKDQFSNIHAAQALLQTIPENSDLHKLSLFQKIEHIIVNGEIIRPSIELLFESCISTSIYRIIE